MIARLVWMAALLALVTACGADGGTGARPAATPLPVDRSGAPPILEPRNLASRAADPCGTLLTPLQLKNLGFGRPGVPTRNAVDAPTCTWTAGGVGSRTIAASVVQTGDLFVDTYRTRVLPIFRPHVVEGLPAVDSQASENSTACTTTVGVADGQTLDVSVARGTYADERDADTCAIGRRVAEEIVSTLPPL